MIVPSLTDLIKKAKNLVEQYKTTREDFDNQRFFGSLRAPTENNERVEGATFIKSLAQHVGENKHAYDEIDKKFRGKDYSSVTAPFLKQAITGAMLLELIKVDGEYYFESSVKSSSALGNTILALYQIDKLSEIPEDYRKDCLQSLKRYMSRFSDVQFHPSKSNDDVLSEISTYSGEEEGIALAGPSN